MTLLETYFELPHTVGVAFTTLGTDFTCDVDRMPVTIRFPRAEHTRNWPLLVPPAFVNVFSDDGLSKLLDKVEWGSESGTSGDDPATKHAWVSAVGLATEAADGQEQEVADRLIDAMDEWWPNVCDWIEVLTRQVHSGPSKTLILGPHHPVWARTDGAVERLYRQGPASITVRRNNGPDAPTALGAHEFEAALRNAAVGPPPLEWLLVRDARLAHENASRRVAVIDAGTATELAISKLLKDQVAGLPDVVVEQLLAGHRMLGASAKLLKKLGGTSPENTTKDLIEPRNKAAHQGWVPSAKESYTALMVAVEIVDAAYPLSSFV
ncbi:hypothetical protein [Nocardioides marmorisolisilvae]|uniref:DUF4145 domain-containing protein n=1 Tax=Nocardioides marmorisolisilvae TaxID=1542737 RepID=A0A3N0DI21_9ACTN|nr:hypothetical protein [Nocardioides marmorisolisilvae]RNL75334.1 hypothetical protein EFL95_18080 [Nocardioides marmorisolisilvae]